MHQLMKVPVSLMFLRTPLLSFCVKQVLVGMESMASKAVGACAYSFLEVTCLSHFESL